MFLVIRKRRLLWLLSAALLAALGLVLLLCASSRIARPAFAPADGARTIVLDAGHGGEDGGAVSADGTVESGINLSIVLRLNDILRFCGQKTVLTRCEDISIYSGDATTLHEKKVSDLKNRVALVNSLSGAVLLSIHQNCMPSFPRVQGAQAFYNQENGASALADGVQEALNTAVNTGGKKVKKQISGSIYLTKNVSAPAVLVECGFLSNREETARLQDPSYQTRLAVAIASGFLHAEREGTPDETENTVLLQGMRK